MSAIIHDLVRADAQQSVTLMDLGLARGQEVELMVRSHTMNSSSWDAFTPTQQAAA